MFANFPHSRARRRGVVLIVVLGMLSLLALIGVTFATFSGQARINARNFSQSQNFPDVSEVMDYALGQLINDAGNNYQSALRGHGLKRDMYGNDANFNGYLDTNPTTGNPLTLSSAAQVTTATTLTANGVTRNVNGLYACVTSILLTDANFYGLNFTGWTLTFPPTGGFSTATVSSKTYLVGETFEIVLDDNTGANASSKFRVFYLAPPDTNSNITGYTSTNALPIGPDTSGNYYPAIASQLVGGINGIGTMPLGYGFILDGRNLNAFNGPGMSGAIPAGAPGAGVQASVYGNFRVNGALFGSPTGFLGNPDAVGMDEDYDACDLENWFLAIQSADGQVIIPSFHRPSLIRFNPSDPAFPHSYPTNPLSTTATNDWWNGSPDSMARFLRPRQADGHSPVSFPDLIPNPSTGQITYDVDNDGDGLSDSVWLDLGFPARRDSEGVLFKPLFAFMVIGLNGRMPLNTAGNLQLRDVNDNLQFLPASHLGNSPSEVDPIFALQAPNAAGAPYNSATVYPNAANYFTNTLGYSQFDNANGNTAPGIPVAVTQTRNLLSGTIPQANPLIPPGSPPSNGDTNAVPFGYISGTTQNYYYMPNSILDLGDNPPLSPPTTIAIPRIGAQPVAGRWGEPALIPGHIFNQVVYNPAVVAYYNNSIRAGVSLSYDGTAGNYIYHDAGDDNYNTFDPTGEGSDYRDPAGAWPMPVERIRRYYTPVDAAGDGQVMTFGGGVPTNTMPTGGDLFGRLSFFKYFRPPGMPTPYVGTLQIPDESTNPLHGYEAIRFPNTTSLAPPPLIYQMAGMPYDSTLPTIFPPNTSATVSNTFVVPSVINVGESGATPPIPASPYLNEADEMRLDPSGQSAPYDAPFGPNDLQWLYRLQDNDGSTLRSRLSSLAPISFLNPVDGLRRRRLFSIDTWEPNNYVWAADNPAATSVYAAGQFAGNASFAQPANYVTANYSTNANMVNLITNINTTSTNPYKGPYLSAEYPLAQFPTANTYPQPTTATGPYITQTPTGYYTPAPSGPISSTPSLAQRGKKINLNLPLPVSLLADEPIRQKWIMEAYQMFKAVLPPGAVDTPEELAQLSQYLTNVIDFRDSDATMTHFINPDVVIQPNQSKVVTPGSPPISDKSGTASQLVYGNPTLSSTFPLTAAPSTGPSYPLHQYGMEYNPIALNEVLAYSFQGGKNTVTQTNRFFVELVNTLTQSATLTGAPATNPTSIVLSDNATPTAPLQLQHWDMVILPDNPENRPDPNTGDLPWDRTTNVPVDPVQLIINPPTATTGNPLPMMAYGPIRFNNATFGGDVTITSLPSAQAGTGALPATNFCVIQNSMTLSDLLPPTANFTIQQASDPFSNPPGSNGTSPQPVSNKANAINPLPTPTGGSSSSQYYWLCLRRPANPFDPTSTMVVVDSIRFAYTEAGVTVTPGPPGMASGASPNYLWSTQRIDPHQGGHAVPSIYAPTTIPPGTRFPLNTAYGYSEQQAALSNATSGAPDTGTGGKTTPPTTIGIFTDSGGGQAKVTVKTGTTSNIYHTLGTQNDPKSTPNSNPWELFPFHDRDFTSVIELAFVPGCPPGLFTKQFVEQHPTGNFPDCRPTTDQPIPANLPNSNPGAGNPVTGDQQIQQPFVFPYLVDNFWYSGASRPNFQVFNPPPYTATNLPTGPLWPAVNGPDAGGWYKMFEFFEVPSTVNGMIGPVAQGNNYDWYRQDTRPGMLNLNLILDEEVFLGLMGNAGLVPDAGFPGSVTSGNTYPTSTPPALNNVQMVSPGELVPLPPPPSLTTGTQMVADYGQIGPTDPTSQGPNTTTQTPAYSMSQYMAPKVVTGGAVPAVIAVNGQGPAQFASPGAGLPGHYAAYSMNNVGAYALDANPFAYNVLTLTGTTNGGFTPVNNQTPVSPDSRMKAAFSDFLKIRHGGTGYLFAWGQSGLPPDRPFRSFSNPDIDTTIMRPAILPLIPGNLSSASTPAQPSPFYWDPGVKNPYITDALRNVQMPDPVPSRRFFQILDDKTPNSNADYNGDKFVNALNEDYDFPNNFLNPNLSSWLTNQHFDITSGESGGSIFVFKNVPAFASGQTNDTRHPYFRSDWLQKVTNLSTVRTHQYAVWITVGFFQVTKQGDPIQANTNPSAAMDIIGEELGLLSGRSTRFRAFYIVDRTKAVGFNPLQPGNFRDCVTFRQVIE